MASNERARGATLLDGGAPLGAALGSLIIAGLIAEFGSWRISFVVAGVGTMVCGLFAWWYIRNNPADHPSVNRAEADHIAKRTPSKIRLHRRRVRSSSAWAYFRYRSAWCMCLGWMFFNAVFYGLLTWMPNYLSAVHGLDIKQLGGSLFCDVLRRLRRRTRRWTDRGRVARARRADRTPSSGRCSASRRSSRPSRSSASPMSSDPLTRRAAALLDPVLPALVRNVLGDPRHPCLHARGRDSSAAA